MLNTITDLALLTDSVQPPVRLLETRFTRSDLDAPYLPAPYTSIYDDVELQKNYFLHKNEVRQTAMHPLALKAGQSPLPNGEMGRPAARNPVLLPELLGGRLFYTNL